MESPSIETDMGLKEEKKHFQNYIEGKDQKLYQIDIYKKINEIYIKCHNITDELNQKYYSFHLSYIEIRNNTPFENLKKAFDNFKYLINIRTSFIDNKKKNTLY